MLTAPQAWHAQNTMAHQLLPVNALGGSPGSQTIATARILSQQPLQRMASRCGSCSAQPGGSSIGTGFFHRSTRVGSPIVTATLAKLVG